MANHVPYPTFGPKGFIAPTEQQILEGVKADTNEAFGGALNMDDSTPQGQLSVSQTAVIGWVNDTFMKYTQQVDPAYSDGRMQDGIGRIYFIERNPALPTTVQALCTGLTGTVIPVGSLTQADDGNLYTCTGSGQISGSGTCVVSFSCNTLGPIPCPAGALNTIYQTIPGWDSVTNLEEGVLGQDQESRVQFERRRQLSVAHNANGSLPAVLGAVFTVDGVIDAYTVENVENTQHTIGGVTVAPNSIYVSVVGGNAADVARAIWSKKAPGCAYNGNTTVTVQDTSNGYAPPLPSYQVSFERPAALPVIFTVTLFSNDQIPANAVDLIRSAIIEAFAGNDGGPRQTIGAPVFASRYYPPVINLGSWARVVNIKVGSINTPSATLSGSINGTVMTVTNVFTGTLAAGQTVQGSGVVAGTVIVSQLTGTAGSTGTYKVSVLQAVSFTNLYTVVASLDDFTTRIDQAPSVATEDIAVLIT